MAETRADAQLRPRVTRTPGRLPERAAGTRAWQGAVDGARGHHRRDQEVQPARAGRRRLPTGTKWSFIPKGNTGPHYLVVNADESEPGTFKDRYLLERDPHALLEGMLIAALAIRSALGFVYIRGEYVQPWRTFSAAVREAYDAGLWGRGFDVVVHRGAGAYICGEETGLLHRWRARRAGRSSSLRSRRSGRLRPADHREQRGDPVRRPADRRAGRRWFAGLGTKTQGGTRMYSVRRVKRPGCTRPRCRSRSGSSSSARAVSAAPDGSRRWCRAAGQRPS